MSQTVKYINLVLTLTLMIKQYICNTITIKTKKS